MIAYVLFRAVAGVALRWYYRDIHVEGIERIPRRGPVLLVVNHPNALVDALLVLWVVPRRVLLTAKATLFGNRLLAAALRWFGVVPLHRASDAAAAGSQPDPTRNRDSFRAVQAALRRGGTVLIFPEGRSHDEPSLAPLKTGAARMALSAWETGGVAGLSVIPIGLTFERKDAPRTRVLVQVGEPIRMASWEPRAGSRPAEALTAEIDAKLRAVTLNHASSDAAARAARLASAVAAVLGDVPAIGVVDRPLAADIEMARRIDRLAPRLARADASLRARAEDVVRRLDAIRRDAGAHGIRLEDARILLGSRHALRFILREGWIVLVGGPVALWGRLNHWLPFRAARALGRRSVESAADPAMRTLVAGAVLVLFAYLVQTTVVWRVWGPDIALGYLVSLPIAADINFSLSDRLRRAMRRAHAFVRFRRHPELHARLAGELLALRHDIVELDQALSAPELAAGA